MYFWAILRVVVFSYPVEGQVFPNTCKHPLALSVKSSSEVPEGHHPLGLKD